MKKLRPVLLVLIIAVFAAALFGCGLHNHQDINKDGKCDVCFELIGEDPNNPNEPSGGGEEDAPSFTLSADRTAVYSGADVTLSVTGLETIGSYTAGDVNYNVTVSNDGVSASLDGMKLTVSGSGRVTVKAAVGGKESVAFIDVLPDKSVTAELISNAVSPAKAYLGVCHNIGLTAENAKYYNIVGEEDYVRINDDGTLEIIGARAKNSVLKVTALNGDLVFEKFYTVTGSSLVAAIREGLLAEGKIGSRLSDIPHSKLAELESLSAIPASPFSELDYNGLKFLTSLKSLDLSGNSLGDLSFLRGLDDLGHLDLSYMTGLDISDGGIKVVNNIRSLPSLTEISICGSLSYVNREIYDVLHTMAANGDILLEVVEGIKVSGADIDAFSETVFFSIDECKAHAERNGGVITPEGEFTHAVISVPYGDENNYFKIDATKLCLLELYGSPLSCGNATPIVSENSLTVNLYNYSLTAPKIGNGNAITVSGEDTLLTLVTKRGVSTVSGANWDQVKMPTPGSAIVCDDLAFYSENGSTLSLYGGFGCTGADGGWSSGPLEGGRGGEGANAVVCSIATFYTYNVRITGGQGGRGGKGCDGGGELYESVLGYFNGAKGGKGGTGGYALYCSFILAGENIDKSTVIYNCLFGGPGGAGGRGGLKHMAGHDGEVGDTGDVGKRYLGDSSGSVTGPIH